LKEVPSSQIYIFVVQVFLTKPKPQIILKNFSSEKSIIMKVAKIAVMFEMAIHCQHVDGSNSSSPSQLLLDDYSTAVLSLEQEQ